MAVSKGFPVAHIRPALTAGHRLFGENRVQEAKIKWSELKAEFPEAKVHLIGPLQTNKVKEAIALFDAIHSLDRPKLAEALQTEKDKGAALPDLFIQVNTGEEPQKAGIMPREAADFVRQCRDVLALPVVGLMCIPPIGEDPSMHFALLRELARKTDLQNLSMGMSGDFETAIRFGASHVRVGSAIFGERQTV